MYKVARVFTIIGIIGTAISGLLLIPIGLFLGAIGVIVGCMALSSLRDEFMKPSIGISVCTLIFCSPIAGIIMLCIPETTVHKTTSSMSTNLQCVSCGKFDASVVYYTVDTALGKMNRPYCPECKAKYDREQSK
ncbi:MAG: hypothetical protein J6L83_00395 [Clostridia bacterium]|nr:hypothetical protein [Clostridia bacterium]